MPKSLSKRKKLPRPTMPTMRLERTPALPTMRLNAIRRDSHHPIACQAVEMGVPRWQKCGLGDTTQQLRLREHSKH